MRILLLSLVALVVSALAATAGNFCYRPPVYYTPPTYYQPPYQAPYYPPYYQEKFVPYVLEVEVYRDRYYALSDIYREKMLIEAFDMMREMRDKMGRSEDKKEDPYPTEKKDPLKSPKPASPGVKIGKATPEALKVLTERCFTCHAAGNDKMDLTDPDAVPVTKRWAAFGMCASRDMPPPPKGKSEAEVQKWKEGNSLKDEELKALYDGWVLVGQAKKGK